MEAVLNGRHLNCLKYGLLYQGSLMTVVSEIFYAYVGDTSLC